MGAEPVQLRAEHVALFKNGYSQVSLVGELPAAKELELRGLPVPVEGSLWWQLPQGARAVQVAGSIRERELPAVRYSTAELLAANVGKKVRLVMHGGQVYEGELTRQPLPTPAALTYPNHGGSAQQQQLSQQAPVFLKNGQGELQEVAMDSVLSVSFAEPPAVPTRMEFQPLLTMELSEPAAGGALRVECLAGGLSWQPTYRLDISDKAELSCMAIITNDMVDLEGVQLELVTGNPELGSDGLPISSLTRLHSMANRGDVYRSRSMTTGAVPSWKAKDVDEDDESDDEGNFSEVTRTQELYHYAIPNFSARKDSTVAREIFLQKPLCRHIYTCNIDSHQDIDNEIVVWHCLNIKNEAVWPWSPGTLVCYSGGKLLARTVLPRTAPGQESRLRLATTLEVKASQSEKLVGSKPLVASPTTQVDDSDDSDDDVFASKPAKHGKPIGKIASVYQGEIALQNNAEHPVEVELSKNVIGRVTVALDAERVKDSPGGNAENPYSRILWRIQLAPGESKTCSYCYELVK